MKRWTTFLVTIATLLTAIGLILFALRPEPLLDFLARLAGIGYTRALSGLTGAVLLAAFFRFVSAHWSEMSCKTLSVTSDEGVSSIGLEAIEDLLTNRLAQEKDLSDIDVDLTVGADARTVDCRLRFKIRNQPDIPGRTDVHKRIVRDTFKTVIPGDVTLTVACVVDEILVDAVESSAPSDGGSGRRKTAVANSEYSGPIYPVPQEDDRDSTMG